jgi:cytochrome c oxidase cbb3-type subunit 2
MSGSDTPSDLQSDKPTVTEVAAAAAGQSSAEDWQKLGAQVYGNQCASCHQPAGGGLPGVFPALAGNPVVVAFEPTEHIGTVLNGLIGKTINGTAYTAPMPGFAAQLTNEEIAAVINSRAHELG